MVSKESIQSHFYEEYFELCAIKMHDRHVRNAERLLNGDPAPGAKSYFVLNELRYFHSVTCYNLDVMHDLRGDCSI